MTSYEEYNGKKYKVVTWQNGLAIAVYKCVYDAAESDEEPVWENVLFAQDEDAIQFIEWYEKNELFKMLDNSGFL